MSKSSAALVGRGGDERQEAGAVAGDDRRGQVVGEQRQHGLGVVARLPDQPGQDVVEGLARPAEVQRDRVERQPLAAVVEDHLDHALVELVHGIRHRSSLRPQDRTWGAGTDVGPHRPCRPDVAAWGHGPPRHAAGRPHARQAGPGAPHARACCTSRNGTGSGAWSSGTVPRWSWAAATNGPSPGTSPSSSSPSATSFPERAVVDGEIVIAGAHGLDFNALLQRIHPAASRVALLAESTPASFVAFDLLALDRRDLRARAVLRRGAPCSRKRWPTAPPRCT